MENHTTISSKYIGKIPTRIDKVIFVSNFSKGVLQNYVSNGFVLENPLEIEDRHCVDVKKINMPSI